MSENGKSRGDKSQNVGPPLPSGWRQTKTSELFSFITSGSRGWAKYYSDSGAKFLRVGNLDHASIQLDLTSVQHVAPPNGPEAQRTLVKPGDLLISVTADVGMIGVVPDDIGEAYINQHVSLSRPANGVFCSYLAWFLASEQGGQRQFARLQRGATKAGLGLDDIRAIDVPYPPLNEQRRIVAKIDELFSDLDAGVAALERAKANLKRYRAAVLKAAVEGRLTEQWRADNPDVEPASKLLERILQERRKKWEEEQLRKFEEKGKQPAKNWKDKYKEPTPVGAATLPALPEGWTWTTLGECFNVNVGATPSRKQPAYWNGDIPWASSGEVQFCRISETRETITDSGLKHSSAQINPRGSVLLGMIGEGKTRGQVALLDIPACNNQNCASIWVSDTPILSEYIYYFLWSQYEVTRRGGSGNNQPALNKTKVEAICFPLPPVSEQEAIVREAERLESLITTCEALTETNRVRSSRLRQSILKRAFKGKLVPQAPHDEPASKLLERIATERAATNTNDKPNKKRTTRKSAKA